MYPIFFYITHKDIGKYTNTLIAFAMLGYQQRQTIIRDKSDIIRAFYDIIHTPHIHLNKLLKKPHIERVRTLRKEMNARKREKRTKKITKHHTAASSS